MPALSEEDEDKLVDKLIVAIHHQLLAIILEEGGITLEQYRDLLATGLVNAELAQLESNEAKSARATKYAHEIINTTESGTSPETMDRIKRRVNREVFDRWLGGYNG